MGFFDGYTQGSKQAYLEEERQKKLEGLDLQNQGAELVNEQRTLQNDATARKNDRQIQADEYADEERNRRLDNIQAQEEQLKKREELAKGVERKNAVQNIDTAIQTALKGNLSQIKTVLTNGTDTNPNNDVKAMVEKQLGGVVTDVKQPDPKLLKEGEEYDPDQIEIEVIDPSGQKRVAHLSLDALGGAMGTPHRIGTDKFRELADGKHKVLEAKKNSVNFDGSIDAKGFTQDLMNLAIDGNPEATKLLDSMMEMNAKDGESLIDAYMKQYAKTKDPKERKKLLKQMQDTRKVIEQTEKKKRETPLQEAQRAVLNATTPEEVKLAKDKLDILQKAKDTTQTVGDKVLEKDKITKQLAREATKKVYDTFNIKAVSSGELTPESMDITLNQGTQGKTLEERTNFAIRLSRKISQDARDKGILDLTDVKTKTGLLSNEARNVLKVMKHIEGYNTKALNTSSYKDSAKVITATKTFVGTVSNVYEAYDELKALGAYEGKDSTGVMNQASKVATDYLGSLGSKDNTPEKAKASLTALKSNIDIMDKISELEKSKPNGYASKVSALRGQLKDNTFRQMKSETYLVMKKMLQAISGMGVTNQELEAYQKALSGTDLTSLPAMMQNLTNAAGMQIKMGNEAANSITNQGLPYTGTKAVLDFRKSGAYLINTALADRDLNDNLQQRISVQPAMMQSNPKMYKSLQQAANTHLGMNNGTVEDYMGRLETLKEHHSNITYSDVVDANKDLSKAEIKKLLSLANLSDKLEATQGK